MTERHPSNGRFVEGHAQEGPAVSPSDRPDAGRAAQSPANTGEQRESAWPAVSPRQPFHPPVVPSGTVPMIARPEHPENARAGVVNVEVQRLDLPGSGPVVSRPATHTASIEPEAGRG